VTTAIDPSVLAAVTAVTVFSVGECGGLSDLTAIDGGAAATLAAAPSVAAALKDAGESGAQIVGYALDGTSLVVYVKHNA